MDWLWLYLRYSLGLGWQDAWRKTSEHVVIGLSVGLVAVGLAWIGTRQFGALLGLVAWLVAVVLFYLYFVAKRLAGRDAQWEHWYNTPAVDGGRQLNVRIVWWDPPLPPGREFSVWLRDSAGKEAEVPTGGALARPRLDSRHDPRHAGNLRRDLSRAKSADCGPVARDCLLPRSCPRPARGG